MKPFLGLFAHWDVISKQEPPEPLKKFFRGKKDSEHFISRRLHRRISSALANPARGIGGNAGNAAATLSDLGIPCVLSCPSRAEPFMSELSRHRIFLMSGGKESPPLKCSRKDEDPEHIVFEMGEYRKIFNYDPVQSGFLLDMDFWNSIKNANYLFLSGFHCVPGKRKRKANEIADFLEKRKFKVHLELGSGKGSLMEYAIKRLLDRNCIDSIGMNETELRFLRIMKSKAEEMAKDISSFLEKTSLERISLHTRDCRITAFRKGRERNLRAAGFSVRVCAAKALGGIKENLEKAKSAPPSGTKAAKSENFFVIPSLVVEKPKIIVGMGDAAAVTDSFFALKK